MKQTLHNCCKIIIYLIIALFAVTLSACGQEPAGETAEVAQESASQENGDITESSKETASESTEAAQESATQEGNEKKEDNKKETKRKIRKWRDTYEDDELTHWEEYDFLGLLIAEGTYDSDGTPSSLVESETEYDSAHNPIRCTIHYSDVITNWREYEYDASGQLVKRRDTSTNYSQGNEYTQSYEYEYDANGNIVKCVETSSAPDNSVTFVSFQSDYNDAGKMVRKTEYSGIGVIKATYEYEYNSAGEMIKRTYCYPYLGGSKKETTECKYDSNGLLEERKEYDENGTILSESEFEMIPSGGNIEYRSGYNADGVLDRYSEYEYDENGNRIIERVFEIDSGGLTLEYEYTYNDNGDMIYRTAFTPDYDIAYYEKYVYQYWD